MNVKSVSALVWLVAMSPVASLGTACDAEEAAGAAVAIDGSAAAADGGASAQDASAGAPVGPTHGPDAEPNYALVFAADRVHSIHIKLAADDYQRMQDNLAELVPAGGFGGFGRAPGGDPDADGGMPGGAPLEDLTTACMDLPAGQSCMGPAGAGTCTSVPFASGLACIPEGLMNGGPGGPGGGGAPDLLAEDPMYVDVEVTYDGLSWPHVGMRYKGNSSIAGSVGAGIAKLPFRLDFDQYEDVHPETQDQRFHGFQKLTFSSNFSDDSQLRDTLFSEILRDRGVPAARCAFYRVFVDTGAGEIYWGLYTMIEDPADGAMLVSQFGTKSGNLYKPEGAGADWTMFSAEGFGKKNNERAADYSDVEAAVAALHADQTDAESWRAGLEASFDVSHFLRWLAVNTVVVNWDTYGGLAHNYYLYGDPSDGGRLKWIPWDHNLSMSTGGGFGPRGGSSDDVFHSDVGENWPLISRLLADPVYAASYREALQDSLVGAFAVDAMDQRMRELQAMIEPFVVGDMGEQAPYTTLSSPEAFRSAVDGSGQLLDHVRSRHALVEAALAGMVVSTP